MQTREDMLFVLAMGLTAILFGLVFFGLLWTKGPVESTAHPYNPNEELKSRIQYGTDGTNCFYFVRGDMARSLTKIECNLMPGTTK